MRGFLVLVLLTCLVIPGAFADDGRVVLEPEQVMTGDEDVNIPANMIGYTAKAGELDELVGDTLFVGSTGWDQQHNGQIGRMLGYADMGDESMVYLVWTKLYGLEPGNARHVVFSTVNIDADGNMTLGDNPQTQFEQGYRSGYTTMGMDQTAGGGYPGFHFAPSQGDLWNSVTAVESPFIPNFFNIGTVPNWNNVEQIWPKVVFSSDGYLHLTNHESSDDNDYNLTYFRFEIDAASGTPIPDTPDDQPILLDTEMMNINSDPTTNMAGDKVAVAYTVSRIFTLGEGDGWLGSGLGQANNDIYVRESLDGGNTWEDRINITNFVPPNENLLPDTNAANGDTLRGYTDVCVIYDDMENKHYAFTTGILDYYREIVFYESMIYHAMKDVDADTMVYTLLNHQPFEGQPESWGRTTDRPVLSFDMDTGILWAAFKATSWGPDTAFVSDASGKADNDIFVTASPPGMYNGYLWTQPVNVTDTDFGGPPGESRSESDPSMALRNEGDWIHLSYQLDLDAGCAVQDEGVMTDNPFVYHRISKQTLLDRFEADTTWLQNYPMHVDSSGFWQDPGEYAWAEFGGFFTVDNRGDVGVGEQKPLQPNEFRLEQNYPNPFNPSTRIEFSLDRAANVKLAVYDVLGREVTQLVDRGMNAGQHNITFFANDLPSGVYFYKLQAGEFEKTRKMVLMK